MGRQRPIEKTGCIRSPGIPSWSPDGNRDRPLSLTSDVFEGIGEGSVQTCKRLFVLGLQARFVWQRTFGAVAWTSDRVYASNRTLAERASRSRRLTVSHNRMPAAS
jgi:hypothetical protein